MTLVILLLIIGIIIFFFLRDRDKMLDSQVDGHGGMKQKYSILIQWLTNNPNARVVKATRDHVQISCVMQTTATYFFITETFGGVEIIWDARLGIMGNHKKKWDFSSTTSEEEIIVIIGLYIEEYNDNLFP